MVEGTIAKGAQAIELGFIRRFGQLHESNEGFLQDILGFGMAEAQCAAVEDDFRRSFAIQRLDPLAAWLRACAHFKRWTPGRVGFVYRVRNDVVHGVSDR